jgi:hypothetical protein
VPFPVPTLPEVIVIQDALLVATQEQPKPAVTPTVLDPAEEPNEALAEDNE